MASYTNKKIICQCCGKRYIARVLKGISKRISADLDTNPHEPALFDSIVMCPYCGYATGRIEKKIDNTVLSVVGSKEYQDIFQNMEIDDIQKKLLLAGLLGRKQGESHDAGYTYLMAYWYGKDYGENALSEAIRCFEEYLESHADVETAITLIDCLRQALRFEEAEETARSLIPYIKEEYHLQIVKFELRLINCKDKLPHSQSEVSV